MLSLYKKDFYTDLFSAAKPRVFIQQQMETNADPQPNIRQSSKCLVEEWEIELSKLRGQVLHKTKEHSGTGPGNLYTFIADV